MHMPRHPYSDVTAIYCAKPENTSATPGNSHLDTTRTESSHVFPSRGLLET